MPTASLFDLRPLVIAALHLPDLAVARGRPMQGLRDHVLRNAEVFADAGIPAIMLQDETRAGGAASAEAVAVTAVLGRDLKAAFPQLALGIIVQAHDAAAPFAIAHATGADFVRLKIFVGGAMTAEGQREGLGVAALAARHALRREDIAILADVHDRTCVPAAGVGHEQAALWAQQLGADAAVLTGSSAMDTQQRIRAARAAGLRIPILVGGGVDRENIVPFLSLANGVIVSRALMRTDAAPDDVVRWDPARCAALMAVARQADRHPPA